LNKTLELGYTLIIHYSRIASAIQEKESGSFLLNHPANFSGLLVIIGNHQLLE
jgi:hypothetical protein